MQQSPFPWQPFHKIDKKCLNALFLESLIKEYNEALMVAFEVDQGTSGIHLQDSPASAENHFSYFDYSISQNVQGNPWGFICETRIIRKRGLEMLCQGILHSNY